MVECVLREFAPRGAEECRGPLQRCHVVTKQRLKALWREVHHAKSVRPRHVPQGVLPASLADLLADDRLVVPGCERHHRLMDERRSLRIPRDRLSGEVEGFCALTGLTDWLDSEYGPSRGDVLMAEETRTDEPNPGSNEAIEAGCICPVMDNWHGDPEVGRIRGFVMVVGCPLHSPLIPPVGVSDGT